MTLGIYSSLNQYFFWLASLFNYLWSEPLCDLIPSQHSYLQCIVVNLNLHAKQQVVNKPLGFATTVLQAAIRRLGSSHRLLHHVTQLQTCTIATCLIEACEIVHQPDPSHLIEVALGSFKKKFRQIKTTTTNNI